MSLLIENYDSVFINYDNKKTAMRSFTCGILSCNKKASWIHAQEGNDRLVAGSCDEHAWMEFFMCMEYLSGGNAEWDSQKNLRIYLMRFVDLFMTYWFSDNRKSGYKARKLQAEIGKFREAHSRIPPEVE